MKRILAAALLCCMLACVPTPGQDAVVNRGEENTEALLRTTPAPDAVPIRDAVAALPAGSRRETGMLVGRLQQELSEIGGARAQIDADVIVPDVDTWPVYAVQKGAWSAADRIAILKSAADGALLYAEGIYLHADKAYWDQVLLEIADSALIQAVDRSRTQAGMETWTESVQEFDRAAPQSIELLPFDEAKATDERIGAFYRSDALDAYVDFSATADRITLDVFDRDIRDEGYVRQGGEFTPGRELTNPSLPLEQAAETARAFLSRLGFEDAALSEAETQKAQRTHAFTLAPESEGWLLVFRRRIGGIPGIAPEAPEANPDEQAYAAAWPQERAVIYIDSDGVWSLDWQNPASITETLNESAALTDFETILRLAQARLRADVGNAADRQITSVRITQMRLGYAVVAQKDAPEQGYTLPVWIVDYETQFADGRTAAYSFTLSAQSGASLHLDRGTR